MAKDLTVKKQLLDRSQMSRIVRRMAGEIVERHDGIDGLVLVGIRTRGVPMAELLAEAIAAMEGRAPELATLDITLYRDDLSTIAPQPVVGETNLPGPLEERKLILCDDVLYTGRTIRAALDEIMDFGRPRLVQLAVLVDRGGRELPIQADFVGQSVETAADEAIQVCFDSTDGEQLVRLMDRGPA